MSFILPVLDFENCRGYSVALRPTLYFQIFKTKKMKFGAGTMQSGSDTCSQSTCSGFQAVVHAGSVGQGKGSQGLKARSPVRFLPGPLIFTSFTNEHIFIFSILIFLHSFNLISRI